MLALNNIGHLVTNDPAIGNGPLGIINNALMQVEEVVYALDVDVIVLVIFFYF
jgi:hypothetical protein